MSKNFLILVLVTLTLSSCSRYQRLLKSRDYELKYAKGVEYYEDKQYGKASELFSELISIFRGTDKGEKSAYYYAYSNFYRKDYITAGYYFRTMLSQYPNSQYTEECAFLSAYCYYKDSPRWSLDQSSTYDAINALQLFITKYASSSKVAEANQLIEELRDKLEQKSFYNAKLFYDLGNYKAATYSLRNSLKDFPDSEFNEEAFYLLVKSHYLFAIKSIEAKQEERLVETRNVCDEYLGQFTDSKHQRDVEKIRQVCVEKLGDVGKKSK